MLLVILVFLAGGMAAAENIDPDNDDSQKAWAENVGWINAEPNGDGGDGIQVGDNELSGWMWSENTGWVSLSCKNTLSCATTDYGVLNDGNGVLTGYGWGRERRLDQLRPAYIRRHHRSCHRGVHRIRLGGECRLDQLQLR